MSFESWFYAWGRFFLSIRSVPLHCVVPLAWRTRQLARICPVISLSLQGSHSLFQLHHLQWQLHQCHQTPFRHYCHCHRPYFIWRSSYLNLRIRCHRYFPFLCLSVRLRTSTCSQTNQLDSTGLIPLLVQHRILSVSDRELNWSLWYLLHSWMRRPHCHLYFWVAS